MPGTVAGMIAIDDAQRHVFDRCATLPVVSTALADALGLVLATAVSATENVPPFDNTAVDGFAVRAGESGQALRIVATMAAGARPDHQVGAGEAIRIMTGAPMPPGADAVVMVEDSIVDESTVRFTRTVNAGDAVRRAGSDVRTGTAVFPAGTVLGPAQIGVLASIGAHMVPVVRRARVAVLSTGDELVREARALEPGEIRESNARMLTGAVHLAGCDVIDLGVVRDDEDQLAAVLRNAATTFDAIVTSGGVSMGDYDVVKAVLSRIADMSWMQIAIKPAKPFAFGLLGGVPVFGLPGNPVSSLVSFELLARPALRQMMGHTVSASRPAVIAVADEPLRRHADGKVHYARVHGGFGPDGRWHVRSTGEQGSHQLASTAGANGLAILADGDGVAAGGDVTVLLLT